MKKLTAIVITTLMLSVTLLPLAGRVAARQEGSGGEGYIYRSENPIPNQYLVLVRNNVEASELESIVSELTNTYSGVVLSFPYQDTSHGFSVQMAEPHALALSQDQRVEFVQEIPTYGFESPPTNTDGTRANVALSANGGQAFASSTLDGRFPVSSIINGETKGTGWANGTGGWHDATGASFPDYLELHFAGEKRIDEIDLFTLQDAYSNPSAPTQEMTFSQWGVTSFKINYWDSAAGQWAYLTQVDGNDRVWRKIEFTPVVTSKLSIMILGAANNFSRVVEVEAWEAPAPTTNVALSANGGQAFASSTLNQQFPVASIINGETKGAGWGAGSGGWHDATGGSFPDYLEVHFSGEKRIGEIDLFTLQNNFGNPGVPTSDQTFTQFGVTAFRVSYWNSESDEWVTLAEVQNNDKVWRKIKFPPIVTSKLSIIILGGANNHSRVVEVEAWQEVTEHAPDPNATQEEQPVGEELIQPIGGQGIPPDTETTWGETTTAAAAVPPANPLGKAANPRYFLYGTKVISLFGMSGSYLPHIRRARNWGSTYDPIKENCTLDDVGTAPDRKPKYQHCIDAMTKAGLNHLQIWVSLNHSVGMTPRERRSGAPNEKIPYASEQPFKWISQQTINGRVVTNKWDLYTGVEGDNLDAGFFTNLRNVVEYCQSKEIMVAVVLFDPWQGLENNVPVYSAYYKSNNIVSSPADSPYRDGVEFTSHFNFVKASKDTANPEDDFIDDAGPNRFLRNVQIAVMQRTVKALQGLKNFYWVLANEPDFHGKAYGKNMVTWHRYMARILRAYDRGKNGGKSHLIAANLASNRPNNAPSAEHNVLDVLSKNVPNKPDLDIDIITGHYVHLKGDRLPLPQTERFSALRILRDYNIYQANGAPDTNRNNMRWGFTEGRVTGTRGDYAQTTNDPETPIDDRKDPLTAEAARVEAWELFMNGGALFDHLSYRWANPVASDNERKPPVVLGYYKLLSKFMSTIPFSDVNLKRMTTNQTNRWINNPPTYGPGQYWAALSNGSTLFLFYQHRSTLAGFGSDRYLMYDGAAQAGPSFVVRKLGCGDFRAEWFYPDGKAIGNDGGTEGGLLKPFGKVDFPMNSAGSTRSFNTPLFKQDIVLKITKLVSRTCS